MISSSLTARAALLETARMIEEAGEGRKAALITARVRISYETTQNLRRFMVWALRRPMNDTMIGLCELIDSELCKRFNK